MSADDDRTNLEDIEAQLQGLASEAKQEGSVLVPFEGQMSQAFADGYSVAALRRILRDFQVGDTFFAVHFHIDGIADDDANRERHVVEGGMQVTFTNFGPSECSLLLSVLARGLANDGDFGGDDRRLDDNGNDIGPA